MCAVHCRMAAKTPYPAYKHKPGVAMFSRATNVCIHCRMAAKTPYPAYKHKPGVAMCGRATNVCRTLPDGGENALSGL